MSDKTEYWDLINTLKSKAVPLVNTPKVRLDHYTSKTQGEQERLEEAVRLVMAGVSKGNAARIAHCGEDRLRRYFRREKQNG